MNTTTTINFSYASQEELFPVIMEAKKQGAKELRNLGSSHYYVDEVISYLIENFYQGGRIGISRMKDVVTEIAKTYEMSEFFFNLEERNKGWYEDMGVKFVNCTSDEATLIAIGKLDEDFCDTDPDCYETAGGYRAWKALAGTSVKYYLNKDLTVTAKFESNCEVDHYNNNFFGVSTGGGTKNYKIGDRVEIRSVNLGREFLDKNWKNTEFKATVKKIDTGKVNGLINEFHPYLSK